MDFSATAFMAVKVLIFTSIFFVWVIRYDNIVREFKEYKLPDWLRDLTGILKLSFAFMMVIPTNNVMLQALGGFGIAVLMGCAQVVHFKSETAISRRLPSAALLLLSLWVVSKVVL